MTDGIQHPLVARVYDPVIWIFDRTVIGSYRRSLISELQGRILDIGTGTGAMLTSTSSQRPDGIDRSLHALEPDPYMRSRAFERFQTRKMDVELIAGVGEQLPYKKQSFDAVIGGMILCTVSDPQETLKEIQRVLKPDGELRVLEHVAAPGIQGRFQRLLHPFWRRIAGNCHLHRETATTIRMAGFRPIEERLLHLGIPPVRPFLYGRYERAQSD